MKHLTTPLYKAYCKALQIIVGRKNLIFFATAYLLTQGYITGTEFVPVALAVLGIQGYLDNKGKDKSFDDTPM